MTDGLPLAGRTDRGTDERATGTATDGREARCQWLTAAEAAARLGVSVRTVRRWSAEGRLAGTRIRGARGTQLRFLASQISGFRLIDAASGTVNADRRTVKADVADEEARADGQCERASANERSEASIGEQIRVLMRRVAQLRAALVLANRDRRRLDAEAEWLRARIVVLEESLPDRIAVQLAPRQSPWWRFW